MSAKFFRSVLTYRFPSHLTKRESAVARTTDTPTPPCSWVPFAERNWKQSTLPSWSRWTSQQKVACPDLTWSIVFFFVFGSVTSNGWLHHSILSRSPRRICSGVPERHVLANCGSRPQYPIGSARL